MKKGSGIAIGLAIGTAIGVATDNVGLWLALGVVFGGAIEARLARKKTDGEEAK